MYAVGKNSNMPENCGKSWDKTEDEKVLKMIKDGKTLNDIALEHKRTLGGIRSRLNVIARDLHKHGMTIEDIQKKLRFVSTDDIKIAIDYVKPEKNVNKNLTSDMINEIKEINKTLRLLLMIEIKKNKLDYNEIFSDLNNGQFENIINKNISNNYSNTTPDIIDDNNKNNDIFDDKLINKMMKYIDDKTKLKEIRIKCNISRDIFYSKVNTLRDSK